MNQNRTFGVEIEAHMPRGKTNRDLEAYFHEHHLNVRYAGYTHQDVSRWKLVTDRSLGDDLENHGEVVSPVLCGQHGLNMVANVANAMRDFGCWVDVKCGLHVHVGARDLDLDEVRKVAKNFVHCESAFDAIMPPSRRGDRNFYVKSNRTAFGGDYENTAINRALDAYDACRTMDELIRTVSAAGAGRYAADKFRKLNLYPMQRQNTIEFRQHSGTVEADKIVNWIELCVTFVEVSRNSQPRKRTAMRRQKVSHELSALLRWLKLSDEARKFFSERAKQFSERNLIWALHDEAVAENARWEAERREEEERRREYELDYQYRMAHRENNRMDYEVRRQAEIRRRRSEGARRAWQTRRLRELEAMQAAE